MTATLINMVDNPSFEANATGWGANNATSYIRDATVLASVGTGALLCTWNGAGLGAAYPLAYSGARISNGVVAGQSYTWRIRVRDASAARNWFPRIEWYNSGLSFISASDGTPSMSVLSTWTEYTITATAPAGAVYATPMIGMSGANPTAGHTTHIDCALLMVANSLVPQAYFDGGYADPSFTVAASPSWVGTANQSNSRVTVYLTAITALTITRATDGRGNTISVNAQDFTTFTIARKIVSGGLTSIVRGANGAALDGAGTVLLNDVEVPQNTDVQYQATVARTLSYQAPARTNLCTCPNFETSIGSWFGGNATLARITSDAHTGAACMEVTTDGTNGAGARLSISGVTPGKYYFFSAWVKMRAGDPTTYLDLYGNWTGSPSDPDTEFEMGPGAAGSGAPYAHQQVTDAAWVQLYGWALAPTGATGLTVNIRALSPSVRFFKIDEVLIEESSSVTSALLSWFDGSSTNSAWSGTTNLSTSTLTPLPVSIPLTVQSAWTSPPSQTNYGGHVIFDLSRSAAPLRVLVNDWPGRTYTIPATPVWIDNREDPIVVSTKRRLPTTIVTLLVLTNADYEALLSAVSSGFTAFAPHKPNEFGIASGIVYWSVSQILETRKTMRGQDPARYVQLTVQEIAAPPASYAIPTFNTWDEVYALGLTWDALMSLYTWNQLLAL